MKSQTNVPQNSVPKAEFSIVSLVFPSVDDDPILKERSIFEKYEKYITLYKKRTKISLLKSLMSLNGVSEIEQKTLFEIMRKEDRMKKVNNSRTIQEYIKLNIFSLFTTKDSSSFTNLKNILVCKFLSYIIIFHEIFHAIFILCRIITKRRL